MADASNPLPSLELPKRWELLEQRAHHEGLDPSQFVERVDAAAERVDRLLRRVRTGGGGLFEVVYGLSGSGKTTFLRTLPKFFDSIRVVSFPKDRPLTELPRFLENSHVPGDPSARVILVERRDNPSPVDLADADAMLAELLETFRTPQGSALILWPITRERDARIIAEKAWDTGRDSMSDPDTHGFFAFDGLPKERYYPIADTTSRNLAGDNLEAFGVTPEVAASLLSGCETISDFFAAVDKYADTRRGETWSVLKERVRVHVWVVLPGDLFPSIKATVSALTQGTRNRIDIDLIAEFIDRPDNRAIYVSDWRARRAGMAHLLRAIDLRLFPLPPNVALAAIRAFGDANLKKPLKQPAFNLEQAKTTIRASRLYKEILAEAGVKASPFAGSRDLSEETSNEYRRVQASASNNDKPLNKALGQLLEICLKDDAPHVKVIAEKRSLPKSELQPDIQIQLGPTRFICLEPTWRSTGAGIAGELKSGQNTLSEAHIKKYVLEKATQFVKDLGL